MTHPLIPATPAMARTPAALAMALAMALALTGCATPLPPAKPTEVRIPVPIPCRVPMPERPSFAVDALALDADIWDQMAALRADRLQRQAYESELEAAIKACQ